MRNYFGARIRLGSFVLALPLVALLGCGGSGEADPKVARNPREAASQVEQAFAGSSAEARQAADAAAQAMRSGDYEKAVVSLQVIRAQPSVTLDQGLAIHSSTVVLEANLIRAAESGDEKARRAYELLKAMKRN